MIGAEGGSNRRHDQARRTRQRLLDAATKVIQRDGAGCLTLEAVADEAEVSKGGLLHHFRSKDDLVVALLDETLCEAGHELDVRTQRAGSGTGAFAIAYLEYVLDPYVAATNTASSILAAAALDPKLLGAARDTFEAWQDRLLGDDGLTADTALLARIVGDGLWLIDLFGLAPPTSAQREAVVQIVRDRIDREIAEPSDDTP